MNMLPVTYSYVRVSKSDDDAKNLDTQLRLLAHHGIHEDLIFTDVASGRTMNRPGWRDLMGHVQPGDTIVVVAFLDRFSRNFEEGVRIHAELTARGHPHRRPPGEHRRQRRSEVLPAFIPPLAPSSMPLRILVMPLGGRHPPRVVPTTSAATS